MRPRSPWKLALALLSLAACRRPPPFDARLAAYRARTEAAAVSARRCADELRVLAPAAPDVSSRALGADVLFTPPGAARVAQVRQEIARREGAIQAAERTIALAGQVGAAAEYRVVIAAARAHEAEHQLCRAREIVSTMVGVPPARPPLEQAAAAVQP